MEETNSMNINEAIKIMKKEVKSDMAQYYLKAIEDCIEEDGTHGLAVQLSYVMCNLMTWKGEQAKEVKKFVKSWIKEKVEK